MEKNEESDLVKVSYTMKMEEVPKLTGHRVGDLSDDVLSILVNYTQLKDNFANDISASHQLIRQIRTDLFKVDSVLGDTQSVLQAYLKTIEEGPTLQEQADE